MSREILSLTMALPWLAFSLQINVEIYSPDDFCRVLLCSPLRSSEAKGQVSDTSSWHETVMNIWKTFFLCWPAWPCCSRWPGRRTFASSDCSLASWITPSRTGSWQPAPWCRAPRTRTASWSTRASLRRANPGLDTDINNWKIFSPWPS